MKLDSRQVAFRGSFPWPTRRQVILRGKNGSIHLLETALVVEGYRQRLFFPVVDWFFRQALSEWTTITVPYSRILRYRYSNMLGWRVLTLIVLWVPIVVIVGNLVSSAGSAFIRESAYLVLVFMMSLPSLVLSLYVCLRVLASRNYLLYRQADGRRALIVFRIRKRKQQQEFGALLESHRATVRGLPQENEPAVTRGAASGVPLLVLCLLLLAQNLLWPVLARLGGPWVVPPRPPSLAETLVRSLLVTAPMVLLAMLLFRRRESVSLALQDAPRVVRLAMLLFRRREPLRWAAVVALVLRAAFALFTTLADRMQPNLPGTGTTEFHQLAGIAVVLFHLLLAIVLALSPRNRKEKA